MERIGWAGCSSLLRTVWMSDLNGRGAGKNKVNRPTLRPKAEG